MKERLYVLSLDTPNESIGRVLAKRGITTERYEERYSVRNKKFPEFTQETSDFIQYETGDTGRLNWDLVIIGHLNGAGFQKAARIPESLHDKTIIVFDDFNPNAAEVQAYAALGYIHFCDRKDITERALEILDL